MQPHPLSALTPTRSNSEISSRGDGTDAGDLPKGTQVARWLERWWSAPAYEGERAIGEDDGPGRDGRWHVG